MTGSGWIKQYRADLPLLCKPRLYAFVSYLRLKATWQPVTITVGLQQVNLLSGQLIFGRTKAAQDLRQSERQIRGHLDALIRANKLLVKTTNKFSILTLVNWDIEQGPHDDIAQQNGQQNARNASGDAPEKSQPQRHKQEVNNQDETSKTALQPQKPYPHPIDAADAFLAVWQAEWLTIRGTEWRGDFFLGLGCAREFFAKTNNVKIEKYHIQQYLLQRYKNSTPYQFFKYVVKRTPNQQRG